MPTKRCLDFKDPLNLSDKKASKPLMEKRRRARINHSLAQLKSLIIDPNTTERTRQSKLEKADILELTVRHLHEINRRQRTVNLLEGRNPRRKFEVGYSECVREVDLFLSNLIDPQTSSIDSELYTRLKQHLNRRLQDLKKFETVKGSFQNGDFGDVAISSSSKPNNLAPDLQSDEIISLREPNPVVSSPNNGDHQLNISECDTTANHFSSLQSPINVTNGSNYLSDLNGGHSHVSSSSSVSEQIMVSEDSNSYSSLSSPSYVSDNRDSPKTQPSRDQIGNHSKTRSVKVNENFTDEFAASNQSFKQIPLVPKHLPNGEWALVLPQNVSLGENGVQSFSAFRLVLPSSHIDLESERHRVQNLCVASPFSGSELDLSVEYYPRTQRASSESAEIRENFELNLSPQCVWRPW